jgi:hypothetical protein
MTTKKSLAVASGGGVGRAGIAVFALGMLSLFSNYCIYFVLLQHMIVSHVVGIMRTWRVPSSALGLIFILLFIFH